MTFSHLRNKKRDNLHLYIPFIDNTIGYDCVKCNAACCRLGSIVCTRREADFIVKHHPSLALFQEVNVSPEENYVPFRKFQSGCCFLRSDLLCDLHSVHGTGSKPFLCRSHPIYFIPLPELGIVTTHIAPGCHWTIGPSGHKHSLQTVTAKSLFEEMQDAQLIPYFMPEESIPHRFGHFKLSQFIGMEEMIRDRAPEFDTLEMYLTWQHAFQKAFFTAKNQRAEVSSVRLKDATRELTPLVEKVRRYLGLTAEPVDQDSERMLFPFISIIRHYLLFKLFLKSACPIPLPQNPGDFYRLVTKTLSVLLEMIKAYRRIAKDIGRPVDYNVVSHLINSFPQRILVLAHFMERIELQSILLWNVTVVEKEAISRLIGMMKEKDSLLGDQVIRCGEGMDLGRRICFLDDVAQLLRHQPVSSRPSRYR